MCYQCNTVSQNPNDILIHIINQHEAGGKFSLRQRILDESIGHYAYRSIHFAIDIIKLKENHRKGYISNVNYLYKQCKLGGKKYIVQEKTEN